MEINSWEGVEIKAKDADLPIWLRNFHRYLSHTEEVKFSMSEAGQFIAKEVCLQV